MRLIRNSYVRLFLLLGIVAALAVGHNQSGPISMSVEAVASTTLPSSKTKPAQASNNPAAATGGSTTASVTKKPSVPACQQGGYVKPTAPAVNAAQPGLHQNVQPAGFYTVYGNSTYEITRQMSSCSPASEGGEVYAASTDYALNWAFDYAGGSDGLCHVTAASVAINIAVVYPKWQPAGGATAGLNASWQKFITSLTAHENGHVQIDQVGAAQLLADLQNFPASDCNTIVAQATAKAAASIQAINQANESYDAATNHGETQGAVLN